MSSLRHIVELIIFLTFFLTFSSFIAYHVNLSLTSFLSISSIVVLYFLFFFFVCLLFGVFVFLRVHGGSMSGYRQAVFISAFFFFFYFSFSFTRHQILYWVHVLLQSSVLHGAAFPTLPPQIQVPADYFFFIFFLFSPSSLMVISG